MMRQCPSCKLQFKDPSIPMSTLVACYTRASGDHWEHDPSPRKRRFDDLASCITRNALGHRVLDVGCANGALLHYLQTSDPSAGWECFGLEPGEQAARTAQQRGVQILGALLDDLDLENEDHKFDVILAIDVLEHLLEPNTFVQQISQHLRPGGVFIALTGDTGAWGWKLQGPRYWYCCLPEHQVFYCQHTIETLGQRNTLELVEYSRISHMRSKPSRIVRDFIRNTLWGVSYRARGFGIPMWKRSIDTKTPPGWLPNKDHMLFALKSMK